MSHLAVSLFGGFQIEVNGRSATGFGTNKNRALFAYLTLESQHPHHRETLASLLWPDRPDVAARNSLRQALHHLGRILAQKTEAEPYLLISSEQVQFNLSSDCWIDVIEFKNRLSACQLHHPAGLGLCPGCLKSLQRAIELYQGEVLGGFTLPRCDRFSDWQIITQETCHRLTLSALTILADYYETNLAYQQLIACTQRMIELEPWRESAYQRQMRALAMSGQREKALMKYKTLVEVLQRELGIPASDESMRLYDHIRSGELPGLRPSQVDFHQPGSSMQDPGLIAGAHFAGRQSELAQLQRFLGDSLAGLGRMAFVSGEAGSGKSALLSEFARRAANMDRDLLVIRGTCCSYYGLGDAFQPFREMLETLAGIPPGPSMQAAGSQEAARRLAGAQPVLLQILFEAGPDLASTLLPTQDLLQLIRNSAGLPAAAAAWLEEMAAQPGLQGAAATESQSRMAPPVPEASLFHRTDMFNQYARLIHEVSRRFPLLILLDDLQWLDDASASLLFYLGSHLSCERILLLGAYRPEDMASIQGQARHPLAAVLNEFQRRYGKIRVDLSGANGLAFIQAYLDSLPNHFDGEFCKKLHRHSGGNALFATELLGSMQAHGEVVQDKNGTWVQKTGVDWGRLPARVRAVIRERLSRLDSESLTLLEAASVQGGVFITAVLAQVLGISVEEITTRLSVTLCKQHRLLSSLDLDDEACICQARYRFRHIVFQKYLYQSLDNVERTRLQRATAKALERLTSPASSA